MRARTPLVLLLFLAPLFVSPLAAAKVTVENVAVPERTAAEHVFDAEVMLRNDGAARTIYLFGALYLKEQGKGPCGPATDPRFQRFTHLVQEPIDIPAGATLRHPMSGGHWQQRYSAQDAPTQPTVAEFCVFVANATAGPLIDYESFGTAPLSIRARNAPPVVDFTLDAEDIRMQLPVTFLAHGSDAEGDPLTFTWDFGHIAASGPARATGETAIHTFPFSGDYRISVNASDGIDVISTSHLITVARADTGTASKGMPGLGALVVCVILVLVARARR